MPRPSSSSNFDEDIAERRVSDALATTLLLVAAVCLLGAIVMQVYECYLYRVPGANTLLADASGKRAAEIHANNLKADLVRTCTQIDATYKKGAEEKPKKGHIEGTNFIADEPMDLSDEMKAAVEQLCAKYGYGYKIFAPVVNALDTGAPAKTAEDEAPAEEEPAKEPAEEAPAEEEPAAEPAEAAPAEEEPAMEPAEEAPAEEAPAAEPAEAAPAEEEPAVEPAEETPAEEEPAKEPAEEASEEGAGGAAEDISTEEETK